MAPPGPGSRETSDLETFLPGPTCPTGSRQPRPASGRLLKTRPCAALITTRLADVRLTKGEDDNVEELQEQELLPELKLRANIAFYPAKFKSLSLLGSGSFGTVTLAEYNDEDVLPKILPSDAAGPRLYALKKVSKVAVAKVGQARHVIDEKNILLALDSPFCLKLYGAFATPDELVFVTEVIAGGDLWSAIYEERLVPGRSAGLPHELVPFYAASIICALAHMHDMGVVYRDLKPENVMIGRNGYPKVIDLGFAKQVAAASKTYTLCGTPEYISPEAILGLGCDQSSDIWSFGVILYEMVMGRTPFRPADRDNVTELFTNIVMSKKCGIELSKKVDERAGRNPFARRLILQLFSSEPAERLRRITIDSKSSSSSAQTTGDLLKHDYFTSNLDVEAVRNQTMVPWSPTPSCSPSSSFSSSSSSSALCKASSRVKTLPVEPFTGDQQLFAGF